MTAPYLPGELHDPIPPDWLTVELSVAEIQAEAVSWHGKVDLDHVALHMLQRRGVRMDMSGGAPVAVSYGQIEQPVRVECDGIAVVVHQGPRPLAS